jgi:hypothetical protein
MAKSRINTLRAMRHIEGVIASSIAQAWEQRRAELRGLRRLGK